MKKTKNGVFQFFFDLPQVWDPHFSKKRDNSHFHFSSNNCYPKMLIFSNVFCFYTSCLIFMTMNRLTLLRVILGLFVSEKVIFFAKTKSVFSIITIYGNINLKK